MRYNNYIMNKPQKSQEPGRKTIAFNRKALHDYTLEKRYEAGVALHGWEVKSLRAGKIQIAESYVLMKKGEAWLLGAHISPLLSASTHVHADPTRSRKLLLHRKELDTLIGLIERKGYTVVPLSVYFFKGRLKLEIALVKGKKEHDKRDAEKNRDWQREKQRLFKKAR
jgi:SsrA-binding protein